MSILNVNKINPVGGGSTITIAGIASVTSSISIASSCTATSYYGNGANLTGIDLGAVTGATGDFSIADKIVHTGDTNTAIRFPAADTFSVETGGSERIRIGSAGQIGIAGANYGTSGQVLTSQGSSSAVQWATPSSGSMTLLATMTTNMSANTQSQTLDLTGYQKLMGTVTSLQRSGGLNDTWFGFNNMTSSGDFSWYRSYLDNSGDTSAQHTANSNGYAYGSVGPGFFYNLSGIAGADSGNNDAEFTVHNLQDGGRKVFEMHARSYLTRNIVINTTGSINTTNAITSFEIHVAQASHRLTGGTIKLYGFK